MICGSLQIHTSYIPQCGGYIPQCGGQQLSNDKNVFRFCRLTCQLTLSNWNACYQQAQSFITVQNLKVRHYEDLLQKTNEVNLRNISEAEKWRNRTTELLQNEEKLKTELGKVQNENKVKEPQNQYTQTEVGTTKYLTSLLIKLEMTSKTKHNMTRIFNIPPARDLL